MAGRATGLGAYTPAMKRFYETSPVKQRSRRTRAEVDGLLHEARRILDGYGNDRIAIRHLCYRLASTGVIAKTEAAFKNVSTHLANFRKQNFIPYGRFVDATRWYHGSTTFDDAAEALEDSISGYRKNLWQAQPYHVGVWTEKEAVASIVVPVADSWGIKTFVCRGFASLTATWEAAEAFKAALRLASCQRSCISAISTSLAKTATRQSAITSPCTASPNKLTSSASQFCPGKSRSSTCRPAQRNEKEIPIDASRSTRFQAPKSENSWTARF